MNLKCTNCNSGKLKKKDDFYECEYCGSKIKIEDTKKEQTNPISSPVETVTYGGAETQSGKLAAIIVVSVIAFALILGICWTIFGAELMGVGSNPLKRDGFFTGNFKNEFSAPYEHSITGNVKNTTNKTIDGITIEVTYTIGTSSIMTAKESNISIEGNGVYTFNYISTSDIWGNPHIQTVKAIVDGKTYILQS